MAKVRARPDNGKLFIDFRYQNKRCRELTALDDTSVNRKRLEKLAKRIDAEIAAGVFDYSKLFPNSKRAQQFQQPQAVGNTGDHQEDVETPDSPQLKAFAQTWFAENDLRWKRSYRKKLHDIWEKKLHPQFGEKKVSDISKPEILQFRAQLAKVRRGKEEGLSPSRINQIMNLLEQLLEEAADRFDFNTPFKGIKPLRIPRTQIDPFSLEEVQQFLATVPASWRPYWLVRFFTGMRTSEIDGLKWKYVDFERREIIVMETRVEGEEDTPKTDGSQRAIQMSDIVLQALEDQKAHTAELSEYVFCTRYGYPLTYRNVNNRVWYPTLAKAGLKRRNPYQTRHTAATLWLAAGESPEWIARQMGHSNTKMLFTTYSRYVPNLTRQDGSAMDRLLKSRFNEQAWRAPE
ncbi:site-specific integrase [Ectothiorhodospira haloalkaliphila]|uniref:site-specific integrase n=1 Tax=Ectothiorhodospira haloalkaliphila TaxID=421628 RepID=UPI001EE9731A|nr:site-specific integrase [Ectothiorhodospira haloalkaliphila]MCG5525928.1 site-specific integrase [Ectothiorhodospira haloalkaliphila]